MQTSADPAASSSGGAAWCRSVLLLADLTESVRLMNEDEAGVIHRWRDFLTVACGSLVPQAGGRVVKSLGDGLLVVFGDAIAALGCAQALHEAVQRSDPPQRPDLWFRLRIGVHVADVVADCGDVFGSGVNLTARIAALGAPGETLVSKDLLAVLPTDHGFGTSPLGRFELKGVPEQIGLHRIRHNTTPESLTLAGYQVEVLPSIVVMPFRAYSEGAACAGSQALADLLCDTATRTLAQSRGWRVISRLSAMSYAGGVPALAQVRDDLGVNYVLSGRSYGSPGSAEGLHVVAELADTESAAVVWAGASHSTASSLMAGVEESIQSLVDQIAHAVFEREVLRCRSISLPRLRSHSLLFGAIALMHRFSQNDFRRSADLLAQLADRHRHTPEIRAWFAKWHVMNVAHGWSADALENARIGARHTCIALESDPSHPLALAVDGLIAAYLNGDLVTAATRYEQALAYDPNESLAWLFKSALHVYEDQADAAVACARQALSLSPRDPLQYYYLSFSANAHLSAGLLQEARQMAAMSLRANPSHLPTYRTLAIAQVLSGDGDGARKTIHALRARQPDYCVSEFVRRYSGRNSRLARDYSRALLQAGLPMN